MQKYYRPPLSLEPSCESHETQNDLDYSWTICNKLHMAEGSKKPLPLSQTNADSGPGAATEAS